MTERPAADGRAIDDVLKALDAVVARALDHASRIGYFAALYRKVTAKVKEGIASGFFDDAPRMERLDLAFATRYLTALDAFEGADELTRSWELAFDAARNVRPIILQHLLAGVNAHINLDLGIAVAQTAPGAALPGLRRDFDRINEILALVMASAQDELSAVSPWMGVLDWIGGRHDEEVIRFSIQVARAEAWRFATELAPLPPEAWSAPIAARDARVAHLARVVFNPGTLLTIGLGVIRARESDDVARTIRLLCDLKEPTLELVEARVRRARA